jgi:hypothetical protein
VGATTPGSARTVEAQHHNRNGELRLGHQNRRAITEPPNYDGPHVPVIVIMTSDSRTYVSHNLKGLLSSEQDLIIGVL